MPVENYKQRNTAIIQEMSEIIDVEHYYHYYYYMYIIASKGHFYCKLTPFTEKNPIEKTTRCKIETEALGRSPLLEQESACSQHRLFHKRDGERGDIL
jgi:hypothetical protein